MHASRRDKRAAYLVSTSVFLAESIKFAISIGMECKRVIGVHQYIQIPDSDSSEKGLMSPTLEEKLEQENCSKHSTLRTVCKLVFSNDCWKLGIPALLYVIQNMLQLFAISNVSPATYQALTQVKILAASLLSVWLLKRRYTLKQWSSVCVLCIGVAILSTSKVNEKKQTGLDIASVVKNGAVITQDNTLQMVIENSAKLVGVLSVLLACSFGSGGAVVMEMVIKDNRASIWVRNAQLATFSIVASGCAIQYDAYKQGTFDPLQHFGLAAWATVAARSLGGFLIAYVLQQCDAVLKGEWLFILCPHSHCKTHPSVLLPLGIATSLAMIMSLIIETYVLGHDTSLESIFGASLVVLSSFTYVRYKA